MPGDLQAPCSPQTTGQGLYPGTKPAEPDMGHSYTRSALALCRSAARVQRNLSVRTDVQDAKFKFKVGGVGGRRMRNQISMDGEPAEALHRTQHMHIFP